MSDDGETARDALQYFGCFAGFAAWLLTAYFAITLLQRSSRTGIEEISTALVFISFLVGVGVLSCTGFRGHPV